MNCEHCKLPRDRLHDCMHSLMEEVARLKSVAAEFHNIDDVAEIRRLRQRNWVLALLAYGEDAPREAVEGDI